MDPSGRAGAAEAVYEWSGSDKGGSDCGESRPGAVRAKDAAAMSGASLAEPRLLGRGEGLGALRISHLFFRNVWLRNYEPQKRNIA